PEVILSAVAAALGTSGPATLAVVPDAASAEPGAEIGGIATGYFAAIQRINKRMSHLIAHVLQAAEASDAKLQEASALRSAHDLETLSLRLSAIVELGLDLASERDAASLFDRLCRATRDILSARLAAVGVLDADGKRVR